MIGKRNPFYAWEQIYDYYEGQKPEIISSKKFFGITVILQSGMSNALGRAWEDKSVVLPEKPNFLQKIVAFLLIQMRMAGHARREKQFVGYAYSWTNARDIFRW